MTITDLVNIRELNESDINFILNSSIQSLSKYTESIFKGWEHSDIIKHIEMVILYCLNSSHYSCFLATLREDTNHIIGYVIANPKTNHILFQYTKYSYRKLGIQKNLLLPLVVDFDEPVVVNWPTKEMLKLRKVSKVIIKHLLLEQLIEDKVI